MFRMPLVSSSSSRTAHRRGLSTSRFLHPPVTNVHSLYRLSLTMRNCEPTTGIAIALWRSIGPIFRGENFSA